MRISVTAETVQSSADVLLDVDDAASVDVVADAMGEALGLPCRPLSFAAKPGVVLPVDPTTAAAAGLRHGVRVGVGGYCPPGLDVGSQGLFLHVTGGPHSGLVFALPVGECEIGRGAVIGWPDDMLLSRRHARLTVGDRGVEVTDLDSSNGTFIDGCRLVSGERVLLAPGAVLGVGSALLEVRSARVADAAVQMGEPGWVNFLRPPRIPYWDEIAPVVVPKAPTQPKGRRFPILMLIAPLVMGLVMVLVMKNMMYALFMLLSPLMVVFNFVSDRQTGRSTYKKDVAAYHEDLAKAQQVLEEATKREKQRLRVEWPDAADTLLTCVLPGRRLWERRRGDGDWLAVRVGTSDVASTVRVTGGDDGSEHRLADVPVGVVLTQQPVVGVAGPEGLVDGLVRWVMCQVAAYHPTRDVSCSFVGVGAGEQWGWLGWLPHLRPDPGEGGPVAFVATTEKSAADHVAWLAALVQSRRDVVKKSQSGGGGSRVVFPAHVVVIRDYHLVRLVPGLGSVLDDGPSVGVFAVCTDREERMLPEECAATVVIPSDGSVYASLRRRGQPPVERVLVEGVSVGWCDRLARELSPLVDVGADDQEGALPTSSRLLDVLSLDPPSVEAVTSGWIEGGRSTRAVIGEVVEGPFAIDIRSDGPHGLVAGTTGSGKSELLQTVVASLAVVNRPDEMNFVLVDYKGGAAFKDCAHLPHTVGMVSDLDGHLTNRALESLSAELRRRERMLAKAGAKDIEDYLAGKTSEDEPMPRLLIIIDEFAALVQELPDFVEGLIDITRRGRSLGTHLILATQRPAGVVSAEIKSNTNLRIALRVTDAGDSTDVIDAPDAAHISKSIPGRGYARLGHSSLVGFQSARVGGRPPGVGEVPAWAWRYRVRDLYSTPSREAADEESSTIPTDLANLVSVICQASDRLGIQAPSSPWLPPLDPVVTLDQIITEFPDAVPGEDQLVLPIGVTDIPNQQRRGVGVYDLTRGAHLAVVGAGRSGRSTVLRAIGAGIGLWLSPADVHVYGVDCGSNALMPLLGLPHVGAVITRDQSDRIDRLAVLLRRIISDRQQYLAMEGYADVTEQRLHVDGPDRLPYIVVLFDGWENFTQVYNAFDSGRLVDVWQQIVQEGLSAGIRVVMTGDRTLLSARMGALFADKLMLRMQDPSDFSAVGLTARNVPAKFTPGRGFRIQGPVETQVAVVASDPAGAAQAAVLAQICRDAKQRWHGLPQQCFPGRVDVLPVRFTMSQLGELAPQPIPDTAIPIAVGGDTLGVRWLDSVEHGPTWLVAGPRHSGRSTVLRTIATFAVKAGWRIVIVTARSSPLRKFPKSDQVVGMFTAEDDEKLVTKVLEDVRNQPERSIVVADDVEVLGGEGWLPLLLGTHIEQIRDSGSLFVGSGAPADMGVFYRGPVPILKKCRCGVLLAPQSTTDADMLGTIVNRSAFTQSYPPGGGFLVRAGLSERVQVIWPDAE